MSSDTRLWLAMLALAAVGCASRANGGPDNGALEAGDGTDGSVAEAGPSWDADTSGDAAAGDGWGAVGCNQPVTSLITNGSFESPTDPAAGYELFGLGADVAGWKVMGATGDVDTLNNTYTRGGFTFPAEDCAQTIELTGIFHTATGVSQSVQTTPGRSYDLSFWVGNIVDPAGTFGTTSTVDVLVDGAQVMAAVNSGGAGTKTLSWQQFSVTFAAQSTSTTIAFVNGDPPTDNSNVLDNVVLR
jgi:hypothetical protein